MIKRSRKEINDFCYKLYGSTAKDVTIFKNEEHVEVTPYSEEFKLSDLIKFAEFFGTTNINIKSNGIMGGYCETCEYVTSEVVLVVKKEEE